jgi:hypothetical protein
MKSEQHAAGRLRILTNFRGGEDGEWWPFVNYIAPPAARWIDRIHGFVQPLRHAWNMYRARRGHDLAIVAASARAGSFFCLLQALLPFRTIPVFLYECLWDPSPNAFKRTAHSWWLRAVDRVCYGYVIFSEVDRESYARVFGVPIEKMHAIPYCTTLSNSNLELHDGGFIFAGGDSLRDYRQLLAALEGLPYKVFIATNIRDQFSGHASDGRLTIRPTTHEEFRELMATASVHVLPLATGFVRSVGHQTYLNGMALGKPVIVTDQRGTREYIESGVDGITVAPGDSAALRQWIVKLMESPQLRTQIGARARLTAARFTGSAHLARLLGLAVDEYRRKFAS